MEDAFIQTLTDLTDDGSYDDAMERLYVIAKIETAMQQIQQGDLHGHHHVWERLRSWIV